MCSLITHRFLSVNAAGAETEYSGGTFQYPVLYIRLTSNVKQSSSSAVRLGVWYRIGGNSSPIRSQPQLGAFKAYCRCRSLSSSQTSSQLISAPAFSWNWS